MKYFYFFVVLFVFLSCSTTKNIPEDSYLLDKYSIKSDNKKIDNVYLESFVRQTPNTKLPLFGKVRLSIYNMAGKDTSKWLTRQVQKLGQAPVIYSPNFTYLSAEQIQKELSNQGYLNAQVDTILKQRSKKKMEVVYKIHSGKPYRIRNYEYTIDNPAISGILERTKRFNKIKKDNLFDKAILEEERIQKNNILRNQGYFDFSKEYLYYKADTTLNSHQVDLFLSLHNDSVNLINYNRYKIRNVTILSGHDPTNNNNKKIFAQPDTSIINGIIIVHGNNNFLRNSTLLRNNYFHPEQYYSDRIASRTYSAYNSIGIIKHTNINFIPIKSNDSIQLLDAQITLSPANIHWFQGAIEGTNSAGDIGIAPSVSYQHRNLFNGAEILGVRLKSAYEFISSKNAGDALNQNFYEYGIDVTLAFPEFLFPWLKKSWREHPSASTQLAIGLNNQHRPEYTRQFFNGKLTYRWASSRNKYTHALDLIDINYIRMPSISSDFEKYLNNPVIRETYKDQLIARTGYNITHTQASRLRYPGNSYTIRGGIETAGWLPRLTSRLGNTKKNNDNQYEILGIAFAEYVKGNISFSHTRTFDRKQSFAYHVAIGAGTPFANSNVMPFEQRYFSGGANSVRGWSTRSLGPGSYQKNDSTSFINQVGDIKLDLSIEYRYKASDLLELATFIDAGNIWTIKNYEGQEGGLFKFSKFYKEFAISYGFGLRFDLSFLLIRLDGGMKAYDPSRNLGDRFVALKPKFSRDLAWHFAIGYPF